MTHILISDPTLRDGNHAVRHQLKAEHFAAYCRAAEAAGVPIIEAGRGNGLGASSLLIGESATTDMDILKIARDNIKTSKLGIHAIPGLCTVKRDLAAALDIGVDVFRIASHCTEADTTERHIGFIRQAGKEVYGVLMMSHMADTDILVEESRKLEQYGAEGVIIMDSAGAYLPADVTQRISALVEALSVPVGFHAHNNLGMAIANSVAAVRAGASIIDGTARGFGA
jgi:4-hydroxy 2-oxovalerate aldolase